MLEEKDLTSEQRVRLECVELAVRVAEVGTHPKRIIIDADELEKYIRTGKQ